MAQARNAIKVYLEEGKSRTFAAALDWPGWCRAGRDEAGALQALVDYGPRYARALEGAGLDFHPPSDPAALVVVTRLAGNATTDFGAPGVVPAEDEQPAGPGELERWQAILQAAWQAVDAAVQAAAGRELRKGPRGGGRDLMKIVEHIMGAEASYLSALGGKMEPGTENTPDLLRAVLRPAILSTLAASTRGEIPPRGPRGGKRWPPRYFVRRLAWHDLDHAWEIEDRLF